MKPSASKNILELDQLVLDETLQKGLREFAYTSAQTPLIVRNVHDESDTLNLASMKYRHDFMTIENCRCAVLTLPATSFVKVAFRNCRIRYVVFQQNPVHSIALMDNTHIKELHVKFRLKSFLVYDTSRLEAVSIF